MAITNRTRCEKSAQEDRILDGTELIYRRIMEFLESKAIKVKLTIPGDQQGEEWPFAAIMEI